MNNAAPRSRSDLIFGRPLVEGDGDKKARANLSLKGLNGLALLGAPLGLVIRKIRIRTRRRILIKIE